MQTHFLLCSERSGSNLITKLLNAHSQICGPSTKHLMNPVFRNLFRYSPLASMENWNALVEDMLNLFNVKFSIWKTEITRQELADNIEVGDFIGLINYFFEKEAQINSKNILFIKENHVYEFFPYLQRFYSTSKFVYQTRDPRDVALSWKKNPTHKGGVVHASLQWKQDQQQYLKLSHLLKEDGKIICLKYEDLIRDTPAKLTSILTFLGLKYESEILDFHKDSLTRENSATQHAWSNLSKGVMSDNSNKFKNELSEQEIKLIEKICFNEMKVLGYLPLNSIETLNEISQKEIDHYKLEEESLEYKPADGVRLNMVAKARFYQNPPNRV